MDGEIISTVTTGMASLPLVSREVVASCWVLGDCDGTDGGGEAEGAAAAAAAQVASL